MKKFNLFDGLVILVLLVVAGSFLWLRLSRKTEWVNVRVVVSNDEWWWEGAPPQWWYADGLSVGQSAYDSFGKKIVEITNIQNFDIGGYRRRVFIDVKLRGAYDTKRQVYLYNFQPVQVGKPLDLTVGKNNVRGVVTYIENAPQAYQEKKIEVKIFGVRPWVASSYTQGLTMKDSLNRPLVSIEDVVVEPSVATLIVETTGGVEKRYAPSLFRDVTLRVRIKVFQSNGVDYFVDRAAIKVGEHIWFQFPQAAIRDAEITKIFE